MNSLLQYLDPSITDALGWTIIHSLWQASLIALVMSAVHRLGKNRSANFRYLVSVLSMALVVIASIVTFSLYYTSTPLPVELVSQVDLSQEVQTTQTSLGAFSGVQEFFVRNMDNINLIWCIGVLIFLSRFLFSYSYTKYLRYTAIYHGSTTLESSLLKIKNKLDLDKAIQVAESTLIKVPLVIGHLKPLILFPIGILNVLSTEEVEAIIMHELAHIKRYDYLTNVALTLVEILFYFHPAVWWISANVKAERENCCDDFALSNDIDKVIYAKALVKLEEIKALGAPALAIPFSSKKNQLLNRIKRIMNMPQTQNDIKEKSIATILLLSMVLLFSNQATSKSSEFVSFLQNEEIKDTTKIEGEEELVLKIRDGKFESLTIDEEEVEVEFAEKLAEAVRKSADHDDSYTLTVKENPVLKIIDDKIHITGDGGVYHESENRIHPIAKADTLPTGNRNSTRSSSIITKKDGKTIEVEKENGKVTKLKIDGKEIPKDQYEQYIEEIESTNDMYFTDEDRDIFFDGKDFSKSFGLLFDGEHWREFGGNMNQFFDEEVFEKLKEMEGLRFDFRNLEDLEELKELERLHELRGLEKLHELEGLQNLEELEHLGELFEEMGIHMDTTLRGMKFDFNFDDFNFEKMDQFRGWGNDFEFDRDMDVDRSYRRGTVVDKIGSMLNKDGLLKEYKSNEIEITGKHLKINGEKMPKAIFEKYKNIYQETTGAPLTKKSKMVFNVEGKPSKRKVRTF